MGASESFRLPILGVEAEAERLGRDPEYLRQKAEYMRSEAVRAFGRGQLVRASMLEDRAVELFHRADDLA
jgi:hypothetical protein